FWHCIKFKRQGGCEADLELITDDFTELSLGAFEGLSCLIQIWLSVDVDATHCVKHSCVVQVTGHAGISNGAWFKSTVFNFALNGRCHNSFNALRHPSCACMISHDIRLYFSLNLLWTILVYLRGIENTCLRAKEAGHKARLL